MGPPKKAGKAGTPPGDEGPQAGPGGKDQAPDLDAFVQEMRDQFAQLGKQFKEVAEKVGDEAQYHFDRELARALAKHPDLYAEVRKTIRQVQKTVDKAAETFGVKK